MTVRVTRSDIRVHVRVPEECSTPGSAAWQSVNAKIYMCPLHASALLPSPLSAVSAFGLIKRLK